MLLESFYHEQTGSFSHVIADHEGGSAAVVDPVLDFDYETGQIRHDHLNRILACLQGHDLTLAWILETHAHADHLTGAKALQAQAGGTIGIGAGIIKVQQHFAPIFGNHCRADGSQFGHLFVDEESFVIGELTGRVMATPGHTSDSITYLIDDCAFIGDTLFHPEVGSARADFPGGNADQLYDSIQKILALPPETRLMLSHDYPGDNRQPVASVTVAEQKADNLHLRDNTNQADYVAMRHARDAGLAAPRLLLPALQVNICAGELPPADASGNRYLKIPLKEK